MINCLVNWTTVQQQQSQAESVSISLPLLPIVEVYYNGDDNMASTVFPEILASIPYLEIGMNYYIPQKTQRWRTNVQPIPLPSCKRTLLNSTTIFLRIFLHHNNHITNEEMFKTSRILYLDSNKPEGCWKCTNFKKSCSKLLVCEKVAQYPESCQKNCRARSGQT